jgi:hypothetical protein
MGNITFRYLNPKPRVSSPKVAGNNIMEIITEPYRYHENSSGPTDLEYVFLVGHCQEGI